MCSPTTYVKLCTCGPEDVDPAAFWSLYLMKGHAADRLVHAVGSFVFPTYLPVAQTLLEERIAGDLNGQDCFDFDYAPVEEDLLQIRLEDRELWFRFIDQRWKAADMGLTFVQGDPDHEGGVAIRAADQSDHGKAY